MILNVEMQRLETLIKEVIVQPDWEKEVYENGPIVYFSPEFLSDKHRAPLLFFRYIKSFWKRKSNPDILC